MIIKLTMIIKLIIIYSKSSSVYLLLALTIILEGKREDGELVVKTPTSNSTEHDVDFQYRLLKALQIPRKDKEGCYDTEGKDEGCKKGQEEENRNLPLGEKKQLLEKIQTCHWGSRRSPWPTWSAVLERAPCLWWRRPRQGVLVLVMMKVVVVVWWWCYDDSYPNDKLPVLRTCHHVPFITAPIETQHLKK